MAKESVKRIEEWRQFGEATRHTPKHALEYSFFIPGNWSDGMKSAGQKYFQMISTAYCRDLAKDEDDINEWRAEAEQLQKDVLATITADVYKSTRAKVDPKKPYPADPTEAEQKRINHLLEEISTHCKTQAALDTFPKSESRPDRKFLLKKMQGESSDRIDWALRDGQGKGWIMHRTTVTVKNRMVEDVYKTAMMYLYKDFLDEAQVKYRALRMSKLKMNIGAGTALEVLGKPEVRWSIALLALEFYARQTRLLGETPENRPKREAVLKPLMKQAILNGDIDEWTLAEINANWGRINFFSVLPNLMDYLKVPLTFTKSSVDALRKDLGTRYRSVVRREDSIMRAMASMAPQLITPVENFPYGDLVMIDSQKDLWHMIFDLNYFRTMYIQGNKLKGEPKHMDAIFKSGGVVYTKMEQAQRDQLVKAATDYSFVEIQGENVPLIVPVGVIDRASLWNGLLTLQSAEEVARVIDLQIHDVLPYLDIFRSEGDKNDISLESLFDQCVEMTKLVPNTQYVKFWKMEGPWGRLFKNLVVLNSTTSKQPVMYRINCEQCVSVQNLDHISGAPLLPTDLVGVQAHIGLPAVSPQRTLPWDIQ